MSKQSINSQDVENLEPTHEFDKRLSAEQDFLSKDDHIDTHKSKQHRMHQKRENKDNKASKEMLTNHQRINGVGNDYLIGIQLKYQNHHVQQYSNDPNKVHQV